MGYRFVFLRTDHEYYTAWTEMRRRRGTAFLTFVGIVPSIAVGAAITSVLESGWPLVVFGTAAFLAFAVALTRFINWKCPKCGTAYFVDFCGFHGFTDECRHCGLPLYAPSDPAKQHWERA